MKKIKIMGILNITQDSFSDGGQYLVHENAVAHALQMEKHGADIIDIGGESTRPGAESISIDKELAHIIPVIQELKTKLKVPLSIDTMKPRVAEEALKAGVSMINDVTGFRDDQMIRVAADFDTPIVCMHMLGCPKTMQDTPFYPQGVTRHLLDWSKERINYLINRGIKKSKIILDPGIGFGKTIAHNLEIIHNLPQLVQIGYPILIGASKKSFMTHITGCPPNELCSASVAVHTLAVMKGVDYIRVHDVKEHRSALDVVDRILTYAIPNAIQNCNLMSE